jgi:protein SMG6
LAETIQSLLEISLAPSVPASLRNIPTKYNIIIRLWTYAFHKLLESFRRASFTSPLALEHLQDFIYHAYTFYTTLVEGPTLATFKRRWLEALGDLARYGMAVCYGHRKLGDGTDACYGCRVPSGFGHIQM